MLVINKIKKEKYNLSFRQIQKLITYYILKKMIMNNKLMIYYNNL